MLSGAPHLTRGGAHHKGRISACNMGAVGLDRNLVGHTVQGSIKAFCVEHSGLVAHGMAMGCDVVEALGVALEGNRLRTTVAGRQLKQGESPRLAARALRWRGMGNVGRLRRVCGLARRPVLSGYYCAHAFSQRTYH